MNLTKAAIGVCAVVCFAAGRVSAQPAKAQAKAGAKTIQAQSSSTIKCDFKEDGQQTIEIANTAYELTGSGVPGRPRDEHLVLRKTTRTKDVIDEIGREASITIEAWPLGTDFKQKPLYSMTAPCLDSSTVDSALLMLTCGVEEVEWSSVRKLATGELLFDTQTPLQSFTIARDILTMRYAGLVAPSDDTPGKRLKDPHVVAVITYASAERVIREALITSDDPKQARLLRSYADTTRTLSVVEEHPATAANKPVLSLRVAISQNYPSAPNEVAFVIPIAGDDLDIAHAKLPVHLHAAAWKR